MIIAIKKKNSKTHTCTTMEYQLNHEEKHEPRHERFYNTLVYK